MNRDLRPWLMVVAICLLQLCPSLRQRSRAGHSHGPAPPVAPAAQPRDTVTDLGTLGGASVAAISNNGKVAGCFSTGMSTYQAFLWEDGVMRGLGTLAGTAAKPTASTTTGRWLASPSWATAIQPPSVGTTAPCKTWHAGRPEQSICN